jgi:hypothetical protein
MEWQGALDVRGAVPPPRRGHSMSVFARDRSIIVMFGGMTPAGTFLDDMYVLNVSKPSWTRIEYGHGSTVPSARACHTLTAISARTLVLFGGDSGDPDNPVALNDVWTFDFNNKWWRQVHPSIPHGTPLSACPSPRFSHTAVFHDGSDLGGSAWPALFVYGGNCNSGRGAVYRLSVANWTWDVLGAGAPPQSSCPTLSRQGPVDRDQHAAVWWPGRDGGMIVVGGDGGGEYLSDVWLFHPSAAADDQWQWREMKITMARSIGQNRIAACAGHSLVQFDAEPGRLLLWGGLRGAAPSGAADTMASGGVVIDLRKQISEGLALVGPGVEPGRRLLFSLVPFTANDQSGSACVVLYGGSTVTTVVGGGESIEAAVGPECLWAKVYFTPASSAAATAVAPPPPQELRQRLAPPVQQQQVAAMNGAAAPPLQRQLSAPPTPDSLASSAYAAPIARGTPLSGRILDVTEVGHFVSVIIKDREYKGVLVVNPGTGRDVKAVPASRPDVGAPAVPATAATAEAPAAPAAAGGGGSDGRRKRPRVSDSPSPRGASPPITAAGGPARALAEPAARGADSAQAAAPPPPLAPAAAPSAANGSAAGAGTAAAKASPAWPAPAPASPPPPGAAAADAGSASSGDGATFASAPRADPAASRPKAPAEVAPPAAAKAVKVDSTIPYLPNMRGEDGDVIELSD